MKATLEGETSTALSNSAVRYIFPFGFTTPISTEFDAQFLCSTSGTVKYFYVEQTAACGAAKSRAYVVRKNGASQSVTLTISGASDVQGSDITNSFSFVAGDLITIMTTPTGTPASSDIRWSLGYETAQGFMVATRGINIITGTTRMYQQFMGGNNWSTASSLAESSLVPMDCTVSAVYAVTSASVGTGADKYTFSLYNEGVQDATTQFEITAGNTTGNITGLSHAITAGEIEQVSAIGSNSPVSVNCLTGCLVIPAVDGESIVCGYSSAGPGAGVTAYNSSGVADSGGVTWTPTETSIDSIVGQAWVARKFYGELTTAPGVGNTRTFTFRQDAADTSLTFQISGTNTTASDTSNEVTMTTWQNHNIKQVVSASVTASGEHLWSFVKYIAPDPAQKVINVNQAMERASFY